MTTTPETIVAAAIYHGCIFTLPAPARHHTILHTITEVLGVDAIGITGENQGFITSTGRYVNRVEAYGVAYRAGQVKGGGPQLYSEDLW